MRIPAMAALTAATLIVCTTEVSAQPGGGGGGGACAAMSGGPGGGGPGGGGMGVMGGRFGGGMGTMTGAGVSLTQLSMLNQMAQIQNRQQPNRPGPGTAGAQPQRQRPTAGQFTRAAMEFDQNKDRQLDEDELNSVAMAVIRELLARNPRRPPRPPASGRNAADRTDQTAAPTTQQMQDAFVERAMDFDRNGDGTLSQSETSRMARAFLRTLS